MQRIETKVAGRSTRLVSIRADTAPHTQPALDPIVYPVLIRAYDLFKDDTYKEFFDQKRKYDKN